MKNKKTIGIFLCILFFGACFCPSISGYNNLTGPLPYEPSIDVEKEVFDSETGKWVDADTENEALDVPICNDVTFKIIIHNNGEIPLENIHVSDAMHDSLKYISADPEPDDFQYNPPFYNIWWIFPGPLPVGETITVYITAHVEGPECSIDYNYVMVTAYAGGTSASDEDYAYVHAYKKSRELNSPILNFLQSHPNLFPLLQKLLQQLKFGL